MYSTDAALLEALKAHWSSAPRSSGGRYVADLLVPKQTPSGRLIMAQVRQVQPYASTALYWTAQPAPRLGETDFCLAKGFVDSSDRLTSTRADKLDYVRSHSSPGARIPGLGLGTALYAGLALTANAYENADGVFSEYQGMRSPEADAWWHHALESKFATTARECGVGRAPETALVSIRVRIPPEARVSRHEAVGRDVHFLLPPALRGYQVYLPPSYRPDGLSAGPQNTANPLYVTLEPGQTHLPLTFEPATPDDLRAFGYECLPTAHVLPLTLFGVQGVYAQTGVLEAGLPVGPGQRTTWTETKTLIPAPINPVSQLDRLYRDRRPDFTRKYQGVVIAELAAKAWHGPSKLLAVVMLDALATAGENYAVEYAQRPDIGKLLATDTLQKVLAARGEPQGLRGLAGLSDSTHRTIQKHLARVRAGAYTKGGLTNPYRLNGLSAAARRLLARLNS